MRLLIAALTLLACNSFASFAQAEDPPKAEADKKELYKKLETMLTNTKLVGRFTITGKDDMPKEEYTILSATKMEQGELWLVKARIQYGGKDITVPMPLEILWAGKTPVITLDKLTIPGLGTFSSRVVIADGKYAGTWQHDAVGGHLFGLLEKVKEEKSEKPEEAKKE